MAVYKRTYKGYAGGRTPPWSRFLVIPRHAWRTLFQYRFLTIFYVLCFFYPVGCALAIYLNNNLGFLAQYMPVPRNGLLSIDAKFFLIYTNVQGALAFLLTAFVGPGLVSPDIVNGGLPLYFCRPFTRTEYVLGKMTVIVALLSNITWIPGLLLWSLQAGLADGWWRENWWLAQSLFLSSAIWILLIAILALAMSAWVRWRIVAGAMMLVVFFMGAGMARTINSILRTEKGHWIDPMVNVERITMALFDIGLPEDAAWEESLISLAAMGLICLWMLARKVKACEVVRG